MKTIEEIENYIEEQDQNGALLVTGKWGSGKTYLIRQIEKIKQKNRGKDILQKVSISQNSFQKRQRLLVNCLTLEKSKR